MYTIAFKTEDGRVVGWLSRNGLMASRRENALELQDGLNLRLYHDKAARLLVGPHPLDHHGPLKPETQETE